MTDTQKTAAPAGPSHSYVLLDRTGSMGGIWDEALGSVNAYVDALSKPEGGLAPDPGEKVTLAVFDHHSGLQFDVIRKGVLLADWKTVTNEDATPRGMTPLFDALARTVALAEADNPDRAVIVVMTDGEENSSQEVTKDGAKAALDRARARGWEVVFLGADFAKFADAGAVGVAGSKSMAMAPGMFEGSMRKLASKNRAYYARQSASVDFNEEDRAESGENDVLRRKGK
jgi:hypothetical protein